jgi:DNA-binding transcriptional ArsR family regulator
MTGILRVPRRAALAAIAALVAAASVTSFAESFRGLYEWAARHGLHGMWAFAWPLQVDVFIAVGEMALFVALADQWDRRSRYSAWCVTLLGLAVSVAGNVGHVAGQDLASRATAAIPPLAAASALAVGLGVLKRVVAAHHQTDTGPAMQPDTRPDTAADIAPDTRPDTAADTRPDTAADTRPGTRPDIAAGLAADTAGRHRTQRQAGRTDTAAAVARLRSRHPEMAAVDIARRLGVSDRTVRRHLVAASANGHGAQLRQQNHSKTTGTTTAPSSRCCRAYPHQARPGLRGGAVDSCSGDLAAQTNSGSAAARLTRSSIAASSGGPE